MTVSSRCDRLLIVVGVRTRVNRAARQRAASRQADPSPRAIETVTACVDEFVGLLDRQIGQLIAGQARDSFAVLMKAVERRGELITYYAGAHTTPAPDLTRELERAHVTALEQFQEVSAKAGAVLTERRGRP